VPIDSFAFAKVKQLPVLKSRINSQSDLDHAHKNSQPGKSEKYFKKLNVKDFPFGWKRCIELAKMENRLLSFNKNQKGLIRCWKSSLKLVF
jgi:hypothetical protein